MMMASRRGEPRRSKWHQAKREAERSLAKARERIERHGQRSRALRVRDEQERDEHTLPGPDKGR